MSIEKLTITISDTADRTRKYIQIMSNDMLAINIVLIADAVELHADAEPAKDTEGAA